MPNPELESSEMTCVSDETSTLPRWELFLIWIIHASQAFQTTMLFPMLVFMIEYYQVGSRSTHTAGQYAGILASLFPLAQFCTSLLWGTVSDSTGRKPWLAFGNIVSALSALFLGLCRRYTWACAVRFLGGLLNGTSTITKSVLGEICQGPNKAKGFGILNLAWGVGSIAGPVISGLLAQPCSQYKLKHCPELLRNHPFILPCIAATLFSIAALFASLALAETRPGRFSIPYVKVPSSIKELQLMSTCEKGLNHCDAKIHADPGGKLEPEQHEKNTSSSPSTSLFRDRNVLLTSFCYSLTGLIFITTDELFPIFGAASREVGGLGLSSSTLGLILGEGGVILFLYTLLLYPMVAQKFGALTCFRVGIISSVPLWLLYPMASLKWGLAAVIVAVGWRGVVACTSFTGVLVLVSNSASEGNVGAVTGLSHSLCSFFRAIGPALGGVMWSFAAGHSFPMHQFIPWIAIAFISLVTFFMSLLLPRSLSW